MAVLGELGARIEGWPTEHIPSRRPAAEAKWAALKAEAGVAHRDDIRNFVDCIDADEKRI